MDQGSSGLEGLSVQQDSPKKHHRVPLFPWHLPWGFLQRQGWEMLQKKAALEDSRLAVGLKMYCKVNHLVGNLGEHNSILEECRLLHPQG